MRALGTPPCLTTGLRLTKRIWDEEKRGSQAFQRLQEEIIKKRDDHSILAWYDTADQEGLPGFRTRPGLLAHSPRCFSRSGAVGLSFKRRNGWHINKRLVSTSTLVTLSAFIFYPTWHRPGPTRVKTAVCFGPHLKPWPSEESDAVAILDCQLGPDPGCYAALHLRRWEHEGRSYWQRIVHQSANPTATEFRVAGDAMQPAPDGRPTCCVRDLDLNFEDADWGPEVALDHDTGKDAG